jgi:type VI secretion system ImpH/TssG family protein
MLSTKYKIQEYTPFNLTFEELVKFVELFQSDVSPARIIQFKTYLDSLASSNGIFQIKHNLRTSNSYRYTVFSNILTLLGPRGILPAHYTERAITLLKDGDRTMVDFLDIFYNKLMYSLYRILKSGDLTLAFQLYALGQNQRLPYLVRQVGAFMGIECTLVAQNIGSFFRYSGAIAMHARSVATLQNIVSYFVEEPVFIEQFTLIKMSLPKAERVQLGAQHCSLKPSFYCGSNIYLYQNKINILIKELSLKKYKKLIVQKRNKDSPLNKLLKAYLGRGIAYSLELSVCNTEKATKFCTQNSLALGIDMWCSCL